MVTVGDRMLDEKLDYARTMLASALEAQEAAGKRRQAANEMGGGIPGFGGSGSQRAATQVRGALDSALRAGNDADTRVEHWKHAVRRYELRIAERDRVRLTREDIVGASWVHDGTSWRKVVRVNAKSVSVESGYSWTDRIEFDRIHQVRQPEQAAS